MSNTENLKRAWQAEAAAASPPSLAEARSGSDRFYRQIRARNRREYIAILFVAVFFAAVALFDPGPVHKIAALLVVLGAGFVAWQLHRRGTVAPPPEEAGLPLIRHQRVQLARQRDALRGVAFWYLLPMLPGLVLFGAAPALEAAPPLRFGYWDLGYFVFLIIVFASVWALNLVAARAIQTEIAALDALEREV